MWGRVHLSLDAWYCRAHSRCNNATCVCHLGLGSEREQVHWLQIKLTVNKKQLARRPFNYHEM